MPPVSGNSLARCLRYRKPEIGVVNMYIMYAANSCGWLSRRVDEFISTRTEPNETRSPAPPNSPALVEECQRCLRSPRSVRYWDDEAVGARARRGSCGQSHAADVQTLRFLERGSCALGRGRGRGLPRSVVLRMSSVFGGGSADGSSRDLV
ncbi:hypothetical protein FA95DRAFT_1078696 [Auriscalpium vulgare]|uniref:Uncharacterized protein n=1 Tax=Auriscalpium vulgare TaxID=40419 RepID=A0ACB8R4Y1_9AGAM|nr:hypothetical protein FA95DRAFT_1078696 [Auriscalpium vulgare]